MPPSRRESVPTIVFALFRNDPAGQMTGGTRSNLEIVSRLRRFRPVVVTNINDDFVKLATAAGVKVHFVRFGDPGKGFKGSALLHRVRGLWDVLRTNLYIARIAFKERAWAVQVDEVQAYLAFLGARLAGSRLLVFVRNGLPNHSLRARYRIPMLFATAILCLSNEMVAMLKRRMPDRFKDRIRQHYNAVSMDGLASAPPSWDRTHFRQAAGWPDDAMVVLVVGFVDARKRQAEFLRALATHPHPKMHIAIVGPAKDDAEWRQCHEIVELHALPVTFHGYQADVSPWYRAADVVALPSSAEGVPRAILEGAGAALPAVAFDIPGCREAILHGRTGLLVASMEELIASLCQLEQSPELRQALGEAGRAHVLESFEARRNVERLEELYQEIV